jgi:fructokinase
MTARRPVIFGEVLFDCFPDGSEVLGGAPFNVAWHLHGFGEAPLFISRVGEDVAGVRVQAAMAGWGMDLAGLQTDADHPTGRVRIELTQGEPSFEIVADQAYDHIAAAQLPDLAAPAFVYHGSLGLRSPASAAALGAVLARHPAPVFLDVNLRAPWWSAESVRAMMARATWLKLNVDELDKLGVKEGNLTDRARELRQRYRLERVVVTRGSAGVLAVGVGAEEFAVRPEAATQVVDTVGAGDAFASVLMLGLLRDWPLSATLRRAQQFASSVVGVRGATVADADFYRHHLETWDRTHAA